MSAGGVSESDLEDVAIGWFTELGYSVLNGPEIAPDQSGAERRSYADIVLEGRLRQGFARLNPGLPEAAIEEAFRRVMRVDGTSPIMRNQVAHQLLVDGVSVEYRNKDGATVGGQVRIVDFEQPANNDWLVVNQFTIIENKQNRRPDIVLFVNGLPLAVLELKNPATEDADVAAAYRQIDTYKSQIPSLFTWNEIVVLSDGLHARLGCFSAGLEWFKPWKTVDGRALASSSVLELETLIRGVFEHRRFTSLLRHFIVFEAGRGEPIKKVAGYHQFHAVEVAMDETLRAASTGLVKEGRYEAGMVSGGAEGDRRVGVVWHTQGSGKSLTMAFYAGRVILHPAMMNPTLVVLTDRNDLDDQLFGTFAACRSLLRQPPVQAASRTDLREKLKVGGGGVVFTTIQKFLPEERGDAHPLLSNRTNVVVIADEAHRSQYGFEARIDPKTGEKTYGFAKHLRDALPNASYIGFTGTPIELTDKNTRAVFGDYISVYDIQRAVDDGATVPIYYESRLAKLELVESEKPKIDDAFEEVTEGEEVDRREKLKSRWAQLEAIVGTEKRIKLIARDLVEHFERRTEAMNGKAMIVCMSRRICVALHQAIVELRPGWHADDDDQGDIKVIMTGSASDPKEFIPHVRSKAAREALALRFRDPKSEFRIVIVRDMWLTGFDAPSLHTMYVDKPMRGHGLMQAIARVNRVFKDKPGGLVVDYLGLADELRQALSTYTESGGIGKTAVDQAEAVAVLQEKYEVCLGLFHGLDWSAWTSGTPQQRLGLLPLAQEHILAQADGKKRLLNAVSELSQAFALAVPHEDALAIRDDVAFFQAVRAVLVKSATVDRKTDEQLDHAVRQIVSKAVASDEVIDIFAAAGLKKPDISILSNEFLADVRGLPQKNVAVELLRKLISGEVKTRQKKNVVQAKSFRELLEKAIHRYQNRAIETVQVIEELIELAKSVRDAGNRGESLGLTEDELAFYDALETNDSAVIVLGDESLKKIARELVAAVKANVSIDWTLRENVQANLRIIVKRILRKHGYPPDKQEKATQTVLAQAEVLSEGWAT